MFRISLYLGILFEFQSLMTNDTSPVVDFYPVNFDLDLNGKLQEWEAVVLIPFIEEVCIEMYYWMEQFALGLFRMPQW